MAQPQLVSKDEQIREAPKLRPFLLRDVRRTGKTLYGGRGAYGKVEELEMGGLVCVGKKMYVGPSDQGTQTMLDKYYNQCRYLSELRHPHIVHFLGICFFPDTLLPVLVTERLHSTLDDMLGQYTEIPLYVKLSFLHDVTKGLLFIHTRNPAVVATPCLDGSQRAPGRRHDGQDRRIK